MEKIAGLVDQVMAAALAAPVAPIAAGSPEARSRLDASRLVERLIQRALWRAERRSRRVPRHVRQSASWVMKQRRTIAYEVIRALRSRGLGKAIADAIAEGACARFPKDGIVLSAAMDRPDRPRARGESPRQGGTNPRARGQSPRQLGTSPRQRRARAAAEN